MKIIKGKDIAFNRKSLENKNTETLILNHTNEGDCILDPFAGAFVVAEVAERLGRNCVSIEIEEF